jgi:hypothetical protein
MKVEVPAVTVVIALIVVAVLVVTVVIRVCSGRLAGHRGPRPARKYSLFTVQSFHCDKEDDGRGRGGENDGERQNCQRVFHGKIGPDIVFSQVGRCRLRLQ